MTTPTNPSRIDTEAAESVVRLYKCEECGSVGLFLYHGRNCRAFGTRTVLLGEFVPATVAAERDRLAAIIDRLRPVASDHRYSDEFLGNLTREALTGSDDNDG